MKKIMDFFFCKSIPKCYSYIQFFFFNASKRKELWFLEN